MKILKNMANNNEICSNVIIADSFFKRLKGLMFTKKLSPDSSMYIAPCNRIHTFFMNYSIDVLYLNEKSIVLDIEENLRPGRIGKKVKGTVGVIELQSGKIKKSGIKAGHQIEII